jgi:hypothetical protein
MDDTMEPSLIARVRPHLMRLLGYLDLVELDSRLSIRRSAAEERYGTSNLEVLNRALDAQPDPCLNEEVRSKLQQRAQESGTVEYEVERREVLVFFVTLVVALLLMAGLIAGLHQLAQTFFDQHYSLIERVVLWVAAVVSVALSFWILGSITWPHWLMAPVAIAGLVIFCIASIILGKPAPSFPVQVILLSTLTRIRE